MKQLPLEISKVFFSKIFITFSTTPVLHVEVPESAKIQIFFTCYIMSLSSHSDKNLTIYPILDKQYKKQDLK